MYFCLLSFLLNSHTTVNTLLKHKQAATGILHDSNLAQRANNHSYRGQQTRAPKSKLSLTTENTASVPSGLNYILK